MYNYPLAHDNGHDLNGIGALSSWGDDVPYVHVSHDRWGSIHYFRFVHHLYVLLRQSRNEVCPAWETCKVPSPSPAVQPQQDDKCKVIESIDDKRCVAVDTWISTQQITDAWTFRSELPRSKMWNTLFVTLTQGKPLSWRHVLVPQRRLQPRIHVSPFCAVCCWAVQHLRRFGLYQRKKFVLCDDCHVQVVSGSHGRSRFQNIH